MQKSHLFDLHTHDFETELLSGKNHFELIELKLCFLRPVESQRNLIQSFLSEKYKGHAIVYIAPFVFASSVMSEIRVLKQNVNFFSDIHLYLIDPFDTGYRLVMQNYKADLLRVKDETYKQLSHELEQLKRLGVRINVIKIHHRHKIDKQMQIWSQSNEI